MKTGNFPHIEKTISAFEKLGAELCEIIPDAVGIPDAYRMIIDRAYAENPWFIPTFTATAMHNIGRSLQPGSLDAWHSTYASRVKTSQDPVNVGVVMAGNVPLVGFQDFIAVLSSGNRFIGKLSSDDRHLVPFLAGRLIDYYPELKSYITFTEDRLKDFDAVIATGSNNTARYFEYYFGKYPHIIRKNRNGVCILTGDESAEDFSRLAEDIFLYFGMGCRNVSKLYVPADYSFDGLLKALTVYEETLDINKYKNNYDYYKSIYLINGVPHLDNGSVLVTPHEGISSPPSVLYFEEYENLAQMNDRLRSLADQVQCIVSVANEINGAMSPGSAQKPGLSDYADGIDTMDFLFSLAD
jgi:hypothetical protein